MGTKPAVFVDGSQSTLVMASYLNDLRTLCYELAGDGTNAPATAAQVRSNLLAAQLGVNTDITSLASGLVLAGAPAVSDSSLKVPTTGWVQGELTKNREGNLLGNVGLSVSVAANALTVALKTASGNDPSASDPVLIGFRSATVTSGYPELLAVTGAVSLTVPSGATLGCSSGTYHRIWVGAINYGGTVELFVYNAFGSDTFGNYGIRAPRTSIGTPYGSLFGNTSAMGTGSDYAGGPYSASARTNVPWTILGCFDITEATAGTWATAPIMVQVNPPFRSGDVCQCVFNTSGAVATTTSAIADDDNVSCSTGDFSLLPNVTLNEHGFGYPNLVLSEGYANVAVSSAAHVYFCSAINGGSATPDSISRTYLATAAQICGISVSSAVRRSTNTQHTRVLGLGTSAGTLTLNGIAGARKKGGSLLSWHRVTEIYA